MAQNEGVQNLVLWEAVALDSHEEVLVEGVEVGENLEAGACDPEAQGNDMELT